MKILSIEVDEAEIIPYLGLIFGMKTWSKGSKTIYHLKARNVSFRMVYGFATQTTITKLKIQVFNYE